MFLFDIVHPDKEQGETAEMFPWRILCLSKTGNLEDTWAYEFFNDPNVKEKKKWQTILKRAASVGPAELPSAFRHEIDKPNRIYEFIYDPWRIAFFYDENKVIVCTHHFRKKSQKTKSQDQDRAVRAKEEYFRAKNAGELTEGVS